MDEQQLFICIPRSGLALELVLWAALRLGRPTLWSFVRPLSTKGATLGTGNERATLLKRRSRRFGVGTLFWLGLVCPAKLEAQRCSGNESAVISFGQKRPKQRTHTGRS